MASGAAGPESCSMHRENITAGKEPYQVLSILTPRDDRIWEETDEAWMLAFKVYVALFIPLYFLLGIISVAMIYKKDCVRLGKTKTFLAVYSTIAILGFTRFLFLALDPYGLLGFIADHFDQWIILSRFLAAFGFPSLAASYTLIFLTLLKISTGSNQTRWYQKWKFVAPIAVIPYVIALTGELIAHSAQYPALFSVLVCDAFFTIWGVVICVIFLFSGLRLLHKVRMRVRKSMRYTTSASYVPPNGNQDDSQNMRQSQFTDELHQQRSARMNKTTRKITIITYTTAVMGIVYSAVSAVNLIVISLLIFDSCLGLRGRGNPIAWLVLQYPLRFVEVSLAIGMLYSITDISSAMGFVKKTMTMCGCRKARHRQDCGTCNRSSSFHPQSNTTVTVESSCRTMENSTEFNTQSENGTIAVVAHILGSHTQETLLSEGQLPKSYQLKAQQDSETSIEMGAATSIISIQQTDTAMQTGYYVAPETATTPN